MKIAIIGGGNVGRTLGVKLDILSHDVTIVESNLPKTIRIDKYIMYNITGDFGEHSHLVKVLDNINELDNDYDIIFICTKIFDGMKVLRKVKKKIKEDGAIVTIQNMFWIDRVSSLIDTKNAVFMQMDFSCYTINDKTIVIDRDGLKLGIVSKEAFDVMQKVTEALSPICAVEQENDIVGFLLGRNVLNIAISMLGAVSGKNLGLILKDKRGRKIFTKVICEGLSLFSAMGVNVLPYNKKLDYGTFARPCSEGKCYRKKIISILRKNNAMVSSSILQDIQLGHKSEVFTVVKTFIKHAQIRKVKIPTINILYTMINDIIKGKRRIDSRVFNEKIFKKLGD